MSSLHDLVKNRPFMPDGIKCKLISFFQRIAHSKHRSISTASAPGWPAAARHKNGGAERDRTADPLLAKQVLSQLSYSPNSWVNPTKPSFAEIWWAWEDLNFRPHAYQACALTN
jgi:hypothetical protein